MNEQREVTVDLDEYKDLIVNNACLTVLLNAIYKDADLSWDGKSLRFSDDNINAILRVMDGNNYYSKLRLLQLSKKAEEKSNASNV